MPACYSISARNDSALFWMHNTLIPLDMLFIAGDGRIADIRERAVPMSDATIPSKVPVRAVLELNGGTVARLGIKLGDVVHYAIFDANGGPRLTLARQRDAVGRAAAAKGRCARPRAASD